MPEQTRLPVCLVTNAHSIVGLLETGGKRVLEVLNDLNTSYLSLNEVRSQRLGATNDAVSLPTLLICKSEITACALTQVRHEAAQRRVNAYVPKVPHGIYVIAGACQCRGTIGLRGNSDPKVALEGELGIFFPITEATLQCGTAELNAKVVFIHRASVAAIQFAEVQANCESAVSLAS
jgi:hypothetical protein